MKTVSYLFTCIVAAWLLLQTSAKEPAKDIQTNTESLELELEIKPIKVDTLQQLKQVDSVIHNIEKNLKYLKNENRLNQQVLERTETDPRELRHFR